MRPFAAEGGGGVSEHDLPSDVGPFPDSIYERVAAILKALPAIGKGQRNTQQNFQYRGHDDVMNELNPLLSKYQVFFAPTVLERITAERKTSKGSIMYEVNLHVQYTFFGPRGDSFTASAWGEGTDMGDKSTNKAMTMALKNVIAQTFAVSTEESSRYDTDQHSEEETTGRKDVDARHPDLDVPQTWAQVEELVMHFTEPVWREFQALMRAARVEEPRFSNSGQFRAAAAGVAVALREEYEPGEFPGPGIQDLQRLWAPAVAGAILTPVYEEPGQAATTAAAEPVAPIGGAQEQADDGIPS